jgi:hypothetical protein
MSLAEAIPPNIVMSARPRVLRIPHSIGLRREGYKTAIKLIEKLGTLLDFNIFRYAVDHDQLFDLSVAEGDYDWVNKDITKENFPVIGRGHGVVEYDARLSADIYAETKEEDSWIPAQIEHLLSFGIAFPDEQRKHLILGHGSIVEIDGVLSIPGLWKHRPGRSLGLYSCLDGANNCRLLEVRKVPET